MSRQIVPLAVCFLIAACATNTRFSSTPSPITAPDVVWFTGVSTVRHFTCSTTDVAVHAEAAPEEAVKMASDSLPSVSGAVLTIPVRSLDCGIHKMNKDLQETLGAQSNPTISFRLWNYVLIGGNSGAVRMNGLLTIAGHQKVFTLYGKMTGAKSGAFRLLGDRIIDVRDFGVTPPRKFFGLMKVKKNITIHFDVAVRPLVDSSAIPPNPIFLSSQSSSLLYCIAVGNCA